MSIYRILAYIAGMALCAHAALAEGPAPARLPVYATDWGLTLKGDGTGFYNALARYILEGTEDAANYTILPYRRAKSVFLHATQACLYPSNVNLLRDGGEIADPAAFIQSRAFLKVKVFLFSRPGTVPPASLADVNDKAVAYAMGSRVPYFLRHATADYIAVADEVAKAQMLISGRVDLMSAAMPDAKFVFDKLGEPLPPHDTAYPLNDTAVRMVCHDSDAARAFITRLDGRIDELVRTGALRSFMESHGLDGAVYTPGAE